MQTIKLFCTVSCIFTFFLVSSCRHPEPEHVQTVQALSIKDTLTARVVSVEDQTEWFNPLRILNVNDQYLVISEFKKEGFFHIFRLPELSFLYSWGRQGRGPDEFMRPPVYINVRNDELIPYEDVLRNLRFYRISDTLLVKTQQDILLSYEGQLDPLNRIRRLNDSLYFVDYGSSSEDTNHEHIALRPGKKEPLFTFGSYPDTELEGFHRYGAYSKTNIAKPDGSKFAGYYFSHNMFKIYNSGGQELKVIQVNDPYSTDEVKDEDDFLYRQTAWASDKYIYIVGLNGASERLFNDPDPLLRTSLEIWDWEGQPVYRAKFDRLVQNFTVSEKYGKLYAFSSLATHEVYEYDLSGILDSLD